jgi:hypothetical protein
MGRSRYVRPKLVRKVCDDSPEGHQRQGEAIALLLEAVARHKRKQGKTNDQRETDTHKPPRAA